MACLFICSLGISCRWFRPDMSRKFYIWYSSTKQTMYMYITSLNPQLYNKIEVSVLLNDFLSVGLCLLLHLFTGRLGETHTILDGQNDSYTKKITSTLMFTKKHVVEWEWQRSATIKYCSLKAQSFSQYY